MDIVNNLPITIDRRQRRIYRRFKRNRLAVAGLYFLIIYVIIAIVGPILVPYDPNSTSAELQFTSPSLYHPLGTDHLGRDVLARVLEGARISLRVGFVVVGMATTFGVTLGLVAGYAGSWIDEAISRSVDVVFAFPTIILGLLIVGILGPGLNVVILALGIAFTPMMIRIARGSTLSESEKEYTTAARASAESRFNIMFKEILPNIISAVVVQATIIFAFAILSEAGLSYLGLSAEPPTATWGVMISEGQVYILTAPWMSIFPGLAIMTTVLGLTFLGVGLRDALDPKTEVDGAHGGGAV